MLEDTNYRELTGDERLLAGFVTDVAQGFYDHDQICSRYGFANRAVLFYFIRSNPAINKLIQQHKTAYESDDNVERRIRLKAGLAVERAISTIGQLVMRTDTPVSQKIECFHKLLRAAGTDGAPPAPTRTGEGGGGPAFTLNFIWSDGTRENVLTARPSAPIIEQIGD